MGCTEQVAVAATYKKWDADGCCLFDATALHPHILPATPYVYAVHM